jgi:uncharacterized membrane protein YphA (DoxX/SURF4 family)
MEPSQDVTPESNQSQAARSLSDFEEEANPRWSEESGLPPTNATAGFTSSQSGGSGCSGCLGLLVGGAIWLGAWAFGFLMYVSYKIGPTWEGPSSPTDPNFLLEIALLIGGPVLGCWVGLVIARAGGSATTAPMRTAAASDLAEASNPKLAGRLCPHCGLVGAPDYKGLCYRCKQPYSDFVETSPPTPGPTG